MPRIINATDLFIIVYCIIPLISLNSEDFLNLGTFFYILMVSITLYIYKLNLSIFNLRKIVKIISKYLPDRSNLITLLSGIFFI